MMTMFINYCFRTISALLVHGKTNAKLLHIHCPFSAVYDLFIFTTLHLSPITHVVW